jgi:ABC-type glycerol-3-phosphate transport system substrate-binding protein
MDKHLKMGKKTAMFFWIFFLVIVFLAGCGKEEEDDDYYIIEMESEQIFNRIKNDREGYLSGTRFYHDEPVQLVGYRDKDSETGEKYINLHLCRTSGEEETLWERIPEEYGQGDWYLDEDGNGYCLYLNEVIRYDREGGERYRRTCEEVMRFTGAWVKGTKDILLLGKTQQGLLNLMALDPDQGELSWTGVTLDMDNTGTWEIFMASNGDSFMLLDEEGIWEGDRKEGRKECIMPFTGRTYVPDAVSDFRVLEDGTAQVLCGDRMETLRRVNISKERKVLVLRTAALKDSIFTSGWLKEGIVRFNKENGEYYVVVEERVEEKSLDFQERTDMELVLGKGPDLVLGVINDPMALIAKGALEDLTPYMEDSGVLEEEYFPATFDGWRGEDNAGIYGVNIVLFPTAGIWVDEVLLSEGLGDVVGAKELVSALEAYEGNSVYTRTTSGLMNDLLKSSDSLCGMVDWENGTCDLNGGILKRILELCHQYQSRGGKDTPVLSGAMQSSLYIYGNIYGNREEMSARGMTAVGCLFDDACRAGVEAYTRMAVSSASQYKEGAWEFIRFLLGEEEQTRISWAQNDYIYPSNKNAFDTMAAKEIAEGKVVASIVRADGSITGRGRMGIFWEEIPANKRNEHYALTEEKVDRVRKMLEETRAFPLRTKPIREIISQEAEAYFAGDKSVDEVCANIQNRVQLYLNEHK